MTRTWAILSLLVLLALNACGKPSTREDQSLPDADTGSRQEGEAPAGGKRPSEGSIPAAAPAGGVDAEQSLLRLSEVRLSPEQLTAESGLTAEPVPLDPLPEDAEFEFRWFLNGNPLEEAAGPTLEPGRFKKKQWLHCQARALANDLSGPWQSSRHVQVLNLPPRIEERPIEDFTVPGRISYQIAASDPDGDHLTFEILSPLEQGIAIDPASGAISWSLTEDVVMRLGIKIEIKFAVSDGDGGKNSGTITLNLTKPN